MQLGGLPYEDCGGLTNHHISIEDAMRVKVAKRPGRPKKRDAERVRNRPVNYELARQGCCNVNIHFARFLFEYRRETGER